MREVNGENSYFNFCFGEIVRGVPIKNNNWIKYDYYYLLETFHVR